MSIVVGLQDPSYCESKAIELISEAKLLARSGVWEQYREKVSQAISLLALCKVQRTNSELKVEVSNGSTEAKEAEGP